MLAAEEWHRYQEDYVRYGVELKPGEPDVKKEKKTGQKKSSVKISAAEKTLVLSFILAVGLCCIAIIFMQAYTSNISYKIYELNQKIDVVEGDIDNLNVTLQSQNNMSQIEYYATNTLQMVYPEKEQRVSISGLVGSEEVDAYIAALSQSQKGVAVNKNITVAVAARKLLSQA